MVAYGASLGVEVQGVRDVAQAYATFTGATVAPPIDGRYTDPPVVTAAGTKTAIALLARLDAVLAESGALPAVESLRAERDRMRSALSADRPAEAYAIGYDAYTRLVEEREADGCSRRRVEQGDDAVRAGLLSEAKSLRKLADTILDTGTQVDGLDAVAQLSVPFALGWTTYADAVVAGIETSLTGPAPPTPAAYCRVAAALAGSRVDMEVFQPDALAIVAATPNPTVPTIRPAPEFLSQYTEFLVAAGDANRDYFSKVLRRGSSELTTASGEPPYLELALDSLATATQSGASSTPTISEEIRRSAMAITYFVVGVGLVADTQSYGLSDPGISGDPSPATDEALMQNAIDGAAWNVNSYSLALDARSIIPGVPAWSARWGVAAANPTTDPARRVAGRVTALNELWYDVVNSAVLYAATIDPS